MNYSPKLKKVIEAINKILVENDVAGIVVLHTIFGEAVINSKGEAHSQGFAEFLIKIDPSYSAAKIENERFKVKGKAEHYSSPEKRDMQISKTVNMLELLADVGGPIILQVMDMRKQLEKIAETIDQGKGGETGFSSHNSQNN